MDVGHVYSGNNFVCGVGPHELATDYVFGFAIPYDPIRVCHTKYPETVVSKDLVHITCEKCRLFWDMAIIENSI